MVQVLGLLGETSDWEDLADLEVVPEQEYLEKGVNED